MDHQQLVGCISHIAGKTTFASSGDLFLHTSEYDFTLRTIKQDMTKAVQFSNTFRYIDDLLSVSNENFGNYISDIYPSDLELKNTTLT